VIKARLRRKLLEISRRGAGKQLFFSRDYPISSLWTLVAGFCFALMGLFVKLGNEYFSSVELVFYRSLVGVIVTFLIMRATRVSFETKHMRTHASRGAIGCIGVVMYFYAMQVLPLAIAVTLTHTAPIFFVLIAAVALRERLSFVAGIAMVVGFVGVALLLQPSTLGSSVLDGLIALGGGFITAVGYLFIRRLGEQEEPESRTVFYFTAICTICAGIMIAFSKVHAITGSNFWILLGVGIPATVAQWALSRAYRYGKSLLTTSLTYTNVAFAMLFGFVVWDEALPSVAWLAFALIVLSGVLASTAPASTRKAAALSAAEKG
jgi:S-adenosylmethionine uptake transporter